MVIPDLLQVSSFLSQQFSIWWLINKYWKIGNNKFFRFAFVVGPPKYIRICLCLSTPPMVNIRQRFLYSESCSGVYSNKAIRNFFSSASATNGKRPRIYRNFKHCWRRLEWFPTSKENFYFDNFVSILAIRWPGCNYSISSQLFGRFTPAPSGLRRLIENCAAFNRLWSTARRSEITSVKSKQSNKNGSAARNTKKRYQD